MGLEPRGIDFVIYAVLAIEPALAFYRDTLGLAVTERPSATWVEFAVGPDALIITVPPGGRPAGQPQVGGAIAAIAVPDVGAAVEELRAQGVPIFRDVWESQVCWGAMVADPDGNLVWLHRRKDGTAG